MKQKKIYYLVSWGTDKTRAWSGTYYGLFSALNKRMDVTDIDTTIWQPKSGDVGI